MKFTSCLEAPSWSSTAVRASKSLSMNILSSIRLPSSLIVRPDGVGDTIGLSQFKRKNSEKWSLAIRTEIFTESGERWRSRCEKIQLESSTRIQTVYKRKEKKLQRKSANKTTGDSHLEALKSVGTSNLEDFSNTSEILTKMEVLAINKKDKKQKLDQMNYWQEHVGASQWKRVRGRLPRNVLHSTVR